MHVTRRLWDPYARLLALQLAYQRLGPVRARCALHRMSGFCDFQPIAAGDRFGELGAGDQPESPVRQVTGGAGRRVGKKWREAVGGIVDVIWVDGARPSRKWNAEHSLRFLSGPVSVTSEQHVKTNRTICYRRVSFHSFRLSNGERKGEEGEEEEESCWRDIKEKGEGRKTASVCTFVVSQSHVAPALCRNSRLIIVATCVERNNEVCTSVQFKKL